MKKLSAALVAVACIFFASSAMAAGVKVPKTLCFDTGSYYYQLVLKAQGTIPTQDGTVKSYSITGHVATNFDFPVSGSAYVAPGSTILHANFDGQYGGASYYFCSYELYYNLATGTGTLYHRYQLDFDTINTGSNVASGIDCKDPTLTIPEAQTDNVD